MGYTVIGTGPQVSGRIFIDSVSAAESLTHLLSADRLFGAVAYAPDGRKLSRLQLTKLAESEKDG